MSESSPRAAHRPSRRQVVIDVAMELFATRPPDLVTVADIAAQAQMTSAAVYYHFPTKDAILLEGMRSFSELLRAELDTHVAEVSEGDSMGELLTGMLTWLDEHDPRATVFFVSSVGVNEEVESLRRDTRHALIDLLGLGTRKARGTVPSAEAAVIGISLLAVLETAAVSWIERDGTYRGLGRRGFAMETSALADRVAGPGRR